MKITLCCWHIAVFLSFFFDLLLSQTVCPNNCNQHGTCDKFSRCVCDEGFIGADCSLKPCPKGTHWGGKAHGVDMAHSEEVCSGRGSCDTEEGKCVCDEGFHGKSCNLLDF